jgi:hypothetical protein
MMPTLKNRKGIGPSFPRSTSANFKGVVALGLIHGHSSAANRDHRTDVGQQTNEQINKAAPPSYSALHR